MERSEKEWNSILESLCLLQTLIKQTIDEMQGDIVYDEQTDMYTIVEKTKEIKSGLIQYCDYDAQGNVIKNYIGKIILHQDDYMIVQELEGTDLVPSSFLLLKNECDVWYILEKERTYIKAVKKYDGYKHNK